MTHLILSFFLLVATASLAQDLSIQWQNTIGGTGGDNARSVSATSDGGYVVLGRSFSNAGGDKSEDSRGEDDYWIVKLDGSGDIVWERTIGGSGPDQGLSVKQTQDGGYILVGESLSGVSGEKTEPSVQWDFWVIKLDSSGDIQWQNTISADGFERTPTVLLSSDGGYFLGGSSNSDISGDKTEDAIGEFDYWLLKLDSNGEIVWQNTIGGDGTDFLAHMAATSDGGVIIGGLSSSGVSGDKTEPSRGDTDYWLVKTDAGGEIEWDRTLGGDASDNLESIFQTSDGGFILGGSSTSGVSGEKTEPSVGLTDYWIVKTDENGLVQWDKTIGGDNGDEFGFTVPSNNDSYLVVGSSLSDASGDKDEDSNGSFDQWVVRLDLQGNIVSQNTIGGAGGEFMFNVEMEPGTDEFIMLCSSNSDISGDKTEDAVGANDYWVVSLSSSLSVGSSEFDRSIVLSPVPFRDSLRLTTSLPVDSIQLIDIHGRLMFSDFLKEAVQDRIIATEALSSGVYILRLAFVDGSFETRKLIKE